MLMCLGVIVYVGLKAALSMTEAVSVVKLSLE